MRVAAVMLAGLLARRKSLGRQAVSALAAVGLSSCTHELVLTPQDGIGPIGHGKAPAPALAYHGEMSVDLGGKHYEGEWTMQEGGFVGTSFGVVAGQVATGTVAGSTGTGNGKAYLTEASGLALACTFSFSSWSETGTGACRRSDGKLFDLMIH